MITWALKVFPAEPAGAPYPPGCLSAFPLAAPEYMDIGDRTEINHPSRSKQP